MDNAPYPGWLCYCGHWQDDGLHCTCCGNEPPQGCDCGFCNDPDDDDLEWLDLWEHYPGELLATDIDFEFSDDDEPGIDEPLDQFP